MSHKNAKSDVPKKKKLPIRRKKTKKGIGSLATTGSSKKKFMNEGGEDCDSDNTVSQIDPEGEIASQYDTY